MTGAAPRLRVEFGSRHQQKNQKKRGREVEYWFRFRDWWVVVRQTVSCVLLGDGVVIMGGIQVHYSRPSKRSSPHPLS